MIAFKVSLEHFVFSTKITRRPFGRKIIKIHDTLVSNTQRPFIFDTSLLSKVEGVRERARQPLNHVSYVFRASLIATGHGIARFVAEVDETAD